MPLLDYARSLTISGSPNPGGGSSTGGSLIRKLFQSYLEPYVEPVPSPGGVVRVVCGLADWNSAVNNAQPGDVIRLDTTINSRLVYRGSAPGSLAPGLGRNGTAERPITITAKEGCWISPNDLLGTTHSAALDIIRARHINVIGVKVRNARFGVRVITSGGSIGNPVKIHHNISDNINENQCYVGALSDAGFFDSSYVSVKYNSIHNSSGNSPYAEGIYIGSGDVNYEWKDTTHDVEVAFNEIFGTRGDGVDIKPGTYNIFAHHNLVHDCGGDLGSGIGAAIGSTTVDNDPNPTVRKTIWIYNNWIYNIGYAFNGISPQSYGINANMGGMMVFGNVIWSLDPSNTNNCRGINCPIYQDVSEFPTYVFNNTVWVDDSIIHFIDTGAADFIFANNLTPDGRLSQPTVTASDFIGPIPTLNPSTDTPANATADAGLGIGSGFILDAGSSQVDNGTYVAYMEPRTIDITGITVPQNADMDTGAYELV